MDQSQTYTSHSSHQVFLREYDLVGGKPVSTGKLLGGPVEADGHTSIGTWADVKEQAATKLGLELVDMDALDIPMLAADPYGNFIPGPNGLPQYVDRTSGSGRGQPRCTRGPVPANVRHFDTPFLTDIAHNADPSPQDTDHNPGTPKVAPTQDADNTASADFANQPPGTYDDEMLDAHFSCGDGRCNENIGLSAIHQVFHSEHDRLVGNIKNTLENDTSATGVAQLAKWQAPRDTVNADTQVPTRRPSTTASGSSRRRASSPRWSTSTWCSRSSLARSSPGSTPSSRSRSRRPSSTRRSRRSSPTPCTASATRC